MMVPNHIKEKLIASKIQELRSLAAAAGTTEILEALLLDENFQYVSSLLNEENAFREYWEQITLAKSLGALRHIADLASAYHLYLMAKICFPKEMEGIPFSSNFANN